MTPFIELTLSQFGYAESTCLVSVEHIAGALPIDPGPHRGDGVRGDEGNRAAGRTEILLNIPATTVGSLQSPAKIVVTESVQEIADLLSAVSVLT